MNMPLQLSVQVVFLIFCRVGGCLMIIPGFSNQRIPVRVRLYIALGIALALTPPLVETLRPIVQGMDLGKTIALVLAETLVGVLIGLMGRMFLLALETLGNAIVMAIGLGNILGTPLNDDETLPALASFITFAATTLIFVLDQHLDVINGLFQSYNAIPMSSPQGAGMVLQEFVAVVERGYLLALRISSPFLMLGLITNFGFGLLNKMVPQVQSYFISVPFMIVIGLYLFYLMTPDFFTAFSTDFGSWLQSG